MSVYPDSFGFATLDNVERPKVEGRSELEQPRPTCSKCSDKYRDDLGLPARVRVQQALILREVATGRYLMIARCHGDVATFVLGDTIPVGTESAESVIANMYVFKR